MCFEGYRRFAVCSLLGLLACACGAAQRPETQVDLSPASLYPLGAAHAWSYDVDTGDGEPVLAVVRVTAVAGEVFQLENGSPDPLRYRRAADGISHAERSGFLLKAPITQGATWPSGPHTDASVQRMHERITTPAGAFDECVTVFESNRDNGQHIETTYCPGIGPTLVASEMEVRGQIMKVTAKLRGYALGGD